MNKKTIESRESLQPQEFGVYEEVSALKKTLSWGPVGTEAVLATLIPEKDSLFFGKMDVLVARQQYRQFENLLAQKGCEIIRVKDLAVWELLQKGGDMPAHNLQELHNKITEKASKLVDRFGKGESSTLDQIMDILIEDANEYGEEGAIRLNSILSETETNLLPMCNLLFGRDQSNVVGNAIVWSKMSKEIRDPEVNLWKFSLKEYLKNQKSVEVTGDGRLEGGDTIIHNGDCLIGVGGRTNEIGVMQVAPEIFKQGLNVYAIYHPERSSGNMEHQTTMHLDTFYMPAPKNTCVVLLEEAKDRQLIQVKGKNSNLDGQVITSFENYLKETGTDIIPISREQQLNYQANFVVLDKNTVLVTTKDSYLRGEFEKRGIAVIDGNLEEITQGYGGAHCSLTPILRI